MGCFGSTARHEAFTPPVSSVWITNRPNTSLPTFPQTIDSTPNRAKAIEALHAHPPMLSTSSSAVTNSPAAGAWSIGELKWSATTTPAHTTCGKLFISIELRYGAWTQIGGGGFADALGLVVFRPNSAGTFAEDLLDFPIA